MIAADTALLPGLLDRLVPPGAGRLRDVNGVHRLPELREAVRLDLEALFGTRQRCLPVPDRYPELRRRSLAGFGMPDFTRLSLESPEELDDLRAAVLHQLTEYEPRLTDVRVELAEPESGSGDRRVRLRILGRLRLSREEVVFVSRYDAGEAALRLE